MELAFLICLVIGILLINFPKILAELADGNKELEKDLENGCLVGGILRFFGGLLLLVAAVLLAIHIME